MDKWEFPNQGLDRTIKITVSANNTSGELPYKVEVDFPCAQVKNKGLLQFVLDPNLPADWNTTNSVEVDFVVAKNQGHPMNGPFDKRNGKPKKRGRYEDIAREGTIDPNSMNLKAHKFSEFGYSIRVWDKSLDLVLGEKDPGIMVIENP